MPEITAASFKRQYLRTNNPAQNTQKKLIVLK